MDLFGWDDEIQNKSQLSLLQKYICDDLISIIYFYTGECFNCVKKIIYTTERKCTKTYVYNNKLMCEKCIVYSCIGYNRLFISYTENIKQYTTINVEIIPQNNKICQCKCDKLSKSYIFNTNELLISSGFLILNGTWYREGPCCSNPLQESFIKIKFNAIR